MNWRCLLFGHEWVEENLWGPPQHLRNTLLRDMPSNPDGSVTVGLVPQARKHCSREGCPRKKIWEYVYPEALS